MNQKDIPGFEKKYAITDDGRVWSYKSKKFLAIEPNSKGYLQVELWKNGKRKKYNVHRLVAEAFLPNPDNLSDVAHLDESKDNCHVNNLCWMTHKDNCNMPKFKERKSKAMKEYMKDPKHRENISKKLSKPVFCEELDTVFESGTAAAAQLGLSQSNISNCCNGRIQTTGKMHFHFATEEEIMKYNLKKSFDELTKAVVEEARMERIGLGYNVPGLLESAC